MKLLFINEYNRVWKCGKYEAGGLIEPGKKGMAFVFFFYFLKQNSTNVDTAKLHVHKQSHCGGIGGSTNNGKAEGRASKFWSQHSSVIEDTKVSVARLWEESAADQLLGVN